MQGVVSKPGIHARQLSINTLPKSVDQAPYLRGCLNVSRLKRQAKSKRHS
jgi:hypothetical protein